MGLATAVGVLCSGCFADDGIPRYEGTYEITHHTRNTEGCAEEGPRVRSVTPYFQLIEPSSSIPKLGWHDCDDPDTCDSFPSLHRSFELRDGEWITERPDVWGGGVSCGLKLIEGTVVESDPGLYIEYRRLEGTVVVPNADACVRELVEVHRDALACEELEVIEAAPV